MGTILASSHGNKIQYTLFYPTDDSFGLPADQMGPFGSWFVCPGGGFLFL